jgi:vitamin K-dependent gamma-carboxylase
LGFLQRLSGALIAVGMTYFMLIEQSHYNNHFYLFIMLAAVMCFVDADKMYSIKKKKSTDNKVPYWHHLILLFLLFVTYFYGGIAKLSGEWLSGRLPTALVDNLPPANGLKSALGAKGFTVLLQYGGPIFDLSIGFLLLYKPTRWFAVIGVIIFNYINGSVLFSDIGHFPLFMVLATVLFFESDFFENIFGREEKAVSKKTKKIKKKEAAQRTTVAAVTSVWTTKHTMISSALAVFVAFQLLMPFRHHLYKGIPEWTGENSRFSWRMKMQSNDIKKFELKFKDLVTQEEVQIPFTQHLTGHQLQQIATDPNYVVQLAKYFKRTVTGRDMTNIVVRADLELSFNGRKVQKMINPQIDLSEIDPREGNTNWIIPLKD